MKNENINNASKDVVKVVGGVMGIGWMVEREDKEVKTSGLLTEEAIGCLVNDK